MAAAPGMATEAESRAILSHLMKKDGNKNCFDCAKPAPTWASATFAVYLCLDCSSVHRNMGAHLSFMRSTNLDKWSWAQLRVMKVGGNASFSDFLARHPGAHSYNSSNTKDKYTSKVANLYKDELARRAKADGTGRVTVDGVADASAVKPANDGDFFDTWDAPAPTLKPPTTASGSSTPLISLGRSPAGTPGGSRSTTPSIPAAPVVPAQPRTVTSSSLRTAGAGSGTAAGASRTAKATLGARTVGTAGVGARGKLGVKKAGAAINFDEAEKRAKEEEERVKRLGYDARKEQEEAAAASTAAAAAAAAVPTTYTPASASATNGKTHAKKGSNEVERLGMGVRRLGFGQTAGMSGEASAKEAAAAAKAAARKAAGYDDTVNDETDYARKNFGTQKGIGSDQYFGRGSYDPVAAREARDRLSQFSGATAISSNMYHGIDDDEEQQMEESIFAANGLGSLEAGARDAVRTVMDQTGIDSLESLQGALRNGALKLSDVLARYA